MKRIAFYLPQYHEVPENNVWWGEGFTEWNTVKNGISYEKGHIQPKRPLDDNYYSLDDEHAVNTLSWQANLAKQYGVDGFCFYHYWFKDNKKMLYKPMEILRDNPEIDLNYCICWANEPWMRTWYAGNSEILIEQDYGNKNDWLIHFDYLVSFFRDKRYIKVDGKPVIVLYRSSTITCLEDMISCWNEKAMEFGMPGLYVISERNAYQLDNRQIFDAYCDFEPAHSLHYELSLYDNVIRVFKRSIRRVGNKLKSNKTIENKIDINMLYKHMGSDKAYNGCPVYPGICPAWDNTPRKALRGMWLTGSNPQLFGKQIIELEKRFDKESFLFINAWNEWSEGAYLEPDKENRYDYLKALK